MKHYYAGYNSYGTKTSNCWRISSFPTKASRDEWVKNDPHDQPSREAMTAAEAKRRINNGDASADDTTMLYLGYDH